MPFQLPADVDQSSPQIKLVNEWSQGMQGMNVDNLGSHLLYTRTFAATLYPDLSAALHKPKMIGSRNPRGFLAFPLTLM